MRLMVKQDYDELSRYVAGEIGNYLRSNPRAVLCLPTGGTPVGVYEELVRLFKEGHVSFAQCTVFNLDEYYPIDPSDPNSYRHYMKTRLFDHIDIPAESTHIPDGRAGDVDAECESYEAKIRQVGGIDLALLGVGSNGHIGFNEPGSELLLDTHLATLSESTKQANCRMFSSIDAVPERAITMGLGSILKARRVIVIASGPHKRRAVEMMLSSRVTTSVPATLLQLHHNAVAVIDRSVGIAQSASQ